jgi:uncharacterized protein (TIGR03083 family)
MNAQSLSQETADAPPAAAVPPLGHDEATSLASEERARFLALLESLSPEDWERPTMCDRWNVRQVVSHVVGAAAGYANATRVERQSRAWVEQRHTAPGGTTINFICDLAGIPRERLAAYEANGLVGIDAVNQIQVDDRADATPADLLRELCDVVPRAIANRHAFPPEVYTMPIAMASGVTAPLFFLTDVIYSRDMWLHRLEITLATNRPIVWDTEHDGRMTALVMRDLARRLDPMLGSRAAVYELTGPAGGVWRYGAKGEPEAHITIETLDFHLMASGRLTAAEAQGSGRLAIRGDRGMAELILVQTIVVY